MSKNTLLLCFCLSLLLTACSKQMVFVGESQNWHVEYHVKVYDTDSESSDIIIKYIGEKPTPEKIQYRIDSDTGASSGKITVEDEVIQIGGHFCDGCAVIREDATLNVTIKWDGKSNHFVLKNKSEAKRV